MAFTVGELRKAIADAPDDAAVMLLYEGAMRHAIGVVVAPTGAVAVIRTDASPRQSKHFSVVEDGLIGGFHAMGMSDELIAELLERSADSIKKRKKTIGLS